MNEAVSLDTVAPGELLSPEERTHYRLAWLSTVDHKRIGILYLLTALVFFVIGGIEAILIRIQLAIPNNHFLGPDTYNQVFTMHGTTMIFLVAMPALFGLINYVLPLQIGARDMAFPRLNALSFWLVPFGGLLLHFSILAGGAPNVGWFAYAPLSETPYSSQPGVDYWAISLFVLGIASVATGINIITTVLCMRAPGMTLRRVPLFVWINFVNAFIIIGALPLLNAGLAMLLIDRRLEGHFFLPSGGGNPILWQHIFWAFGHPEVYILALPAFGILSEIIPVFSRKPIFGYEFVAASSVIIAVLSMGVWAHHMFTSGLGRPVDLFFAISSMLIAIPTGVKVLNWTATMFGGQVHFKTAMCFCVAALFQFIPAGLTGISHAMAALDWQTHNTYFLVAHFHFVAVGLIVFAILGAVTYWFPKMSGKMLSERLGMWSFWLMVIGFNMTFIIQHFLGFMGMGRRVYTYPDFPNWTWMNLLSSFGVVFMTAAALFLVWNVISTLLWGDPAPDDPWKGWTLEWATTSPPPPENFHELPRILSRRPLWDLTNPDRPDPVVGTPNDRVVAPNKFKAAILAFIASEVGFFAILILAYLLYNAKPQAGPNAKDLNLYKTLFFSACLFASSFTIWRSEHGLRKGNRGAALRWLLATFVLGSVFILGQGFEYWDLARHGVGVASNLFATSFFTLTGFHGLHVCLGLLTMLVLIALVIAGDFSERNASVLQAFGYYWHFVDAVWVFVLTAVYILPLFQ